MQVLRKLAPVAEDNGVTLAVETVRPEESRVVITLPELKRLLDAVDHPNVKATLDVTAMGVAGRKKVEKEFNREIVIQKYIDEVERA